MQLVVVKFVDPTTHSHWASLEEISKTKCRVCFAHGVLLEENEEKVTVALLSSDGKSHSSDWIDIPAGCVLSIEAIKEVDWGVSNEA